MAVFAIVLDEDTPDDWDELQRNFPSDHYFVLEERLRRVEQAVVLLEERSRHQATKAWVLAGVLGGMGIASGVALGIAKLVWNG